MPLSSAKKKIVYQEVLREVAESMVRFHRPSLLVKLVIRFIDREIGLSHTSVLISDESKKHFVFVDSKGSRRFPIGLLKFEMDHPLVAWFQSLGKKSRLKTDYLFRPQVEKMCDDEKLNIDYPEQKHILEKIRKAMQDLKVELIVPGYYKRSLLTFLMLGKKKTGRSFNPAEISFFQTLAYHCSMAIKTAQYHENLAAQNQELAKKIREIEFLRNKEKETYRQILRSLAQEVNAKDPMTFGHINEVEYLGSMTAKELGLDLDEHRKEILSAALILHDVGKIGIPDRILGKPKRLDPDEWIIMKTHVEKGVQILEPLADFGDVREIVRCHHERIDGSGYPRGLKADEIPIE
ncbi:MAG: HD domain-containing protein, partial [Candidatus Omnitrophica bacterium]|nr:HD domain-containing protein [Candidatus Omnitrophota bacterium]